MSLTESLRRFMVDTGGTGVTSAQFARNAFGWLGPAGFPAAAWVERVPASRRATYEQANADPYVVAEALTNAAKHAPASFVRVEAKAEVSDGDLRVSVQDGGSGGADPASGSGLVGLTDRVEALGGKLTLHSPPGGGTTLRIDLPISG